MTLSNKKITFLIKEEERETLKNFFDIVENDENFYEVNADDIYAFLRNIAEKRPSFTTDNGDTIEIVVTEN